MGKKRIIGFGLASAFCCFMLFFPSPVSADFTWTDHTPGHNLDVWSSLHMAENGTIDFTISGDVNFDVYIATLNNAIRHDNNESFAYIQELSAINVTHADISGELAKGDYAVIVRSYGPGSITGSEVQQTYRSTGFPIPWDTIGIIAVTAAVTALATFTFMKERRRSN